MGPLVVGIEKDSLEKILCHVLTAFKTTGRKEFSSEYSRESSTVLIHDPSPELVWNRQLLRPLLLVQRDSGIQRQKQKFFFPRPLGESDFWTPMGPIGPQESGRGDRKAEGAPRFAGGGEGVSIKRRMAIP